jgi:hypothetical protein
MDRSQSAEEEGERHPRRRNNVYNRTENNFKPLSRTGGGSRDTLAENESHWTHLLMPCMALSVESMRLSKGNRPPTLMEPPFQWKEAVKTKPTTNCSTTCDAENHCRKAC